MDLRFTCGVFYVLDAILLAGYLIKTFRKHQYVLSVFNTSFLLWAFSLAISPVFYFSDESWAVLGVSQASYMHDYLLKSMCINLTGQFVFLIALIAFTSQKSTNTGTLVKKHVELIDDNVMKVTCYCAIALFIVICLAYNEGTFPLLNGGRMFYMNKPISPLYQALIAMISILGACYGIRYALKRHGLIAFLLCAACLLLSGSRGSLLTALILPVFLMWIYWSDYKRGFHGISIRSHFAIALLLIIVLAGGLVMIGVRDGGGFSSVENYVSQIFYGTTFSDVRDGAYILKGVNDSLDNELLLGKTYLADFISFVPSSMSEFRELWSWGKFSSTMLFGITGVGGFRGGFFMEGFLNFGPLGIVFIALALAMVLAKLEKLFQACFLLDMAHLDGKELIPCGILAALFGALGCSSGMSSVYVAAILLFALELLSIPFVARNHVTKQNIGGSSSNQETTDSARFANR